MLVGDIYGSDYSKLGLKSTMIASSFGKVFKNRGQKGTFTPEDISKSLLYAVSNNIGQIACVRCPVISIIYICIDANPVAQLHECGEVQPRPHLLWGLLHPGYAVAPP